MQNFVQLLKDHTLILSAAQSLDDLVAQAAPAPAQAHDALRRLAHILDLHLRAEDAFLAQDGETAHPEFTILSDAHGQLFDDLVSEWGVYLREWSEENIAHDWATFAGETRRILAQLIAQVDAENRSLYPAALKYGVIRLLPEGMQGALVKQAA